MITMKTKGAGDFAARFFLENQLKDRKLWEKFVEVFRTHPDSEKNGWRGEFWGKMMRGASLVYAYTKDEALYEILEETVRDLLGVAEEDGRVSSYKREKEICGWDLWCRKYVILGLEYYLEICRDEKLKKEILSFLCGCADYILKYVGSGEGQIPITDTSRSWRGMNSSSILEPMVRLYRLTEEERYLDFAHHIVECGGAKEINVFRLAYENKLYPYQYGVAKAYEMMSCFEGLLEYYKVTGKEWCRDAVIRFSKAVMKSEISVIGCSGITNELFDFTAARQTVRQEDVSQETCVTVTWMKLCGKLLKLTGDPSYADCIEHSFYNAYLGALNIEKKVSPYMRKMYEENPVVENFKETILPVDSYSPLIAGNRGRCVGGNQYLSDGSYYGCCASIASAGVGVFLDQMITKDDEGITINFFEEGSTLLEYQGATVEIFQKTDYPVSEKVKITVKASKPTEFKLRIRIPSWTGKGGYETHEKIWTEDEIKLLFPMEIRTQHPQKWEKATVYIPKEETVYHTPEEEDFVALSRGPITLAAEDSPEKKANAVFDFEHAGEICEKDPDRLLKMRFLDRGGKVFYLYDYASSGKDWQKEIAPWLRTK